MMSTLQVVTKLPLPTGIKLKWTRSLLDKAYAKDIAEARKQNDLSRVESLRGDHIFEAQLYEEEEDAYFTKSILRSARSLKIPIPHIHKEDGSESDDWYEGPLTHSWYLTPRGYSNLRDEIRKEKKARHEVRSMWVVWVSALTGLIGTLTGLVALLTHKTP